MEEKYHIVAIHQPNFLPWLGYFYKIAHCHQFIFYDSAIYSKGSYIKRVRIHARDEIKKFEYLSYITEKHSHQASINEIVCLSDPSRSNNRIRNKLYETYHQAPFYFQIEEILEVFFSSSSLESTFSEFNIKLICFICEKLGIKRKFHKTSQLETIQSASVAVANFTNQVDGTQYLSGTGSKSYLKENDFNSLGINLHYSNFKSSFEQSNFPLAFYDKSILSYLAYYSYADIFNFINPS